MRPGIIIRTGDWRGAIRCGNDDGGLRVHSYSLQPLRQWDLRGLLHFGVFLLYPYTSGVVEDREVMPFYHFLFTFLFIVLSHYVFWVWWMGWYSVFSLLVGVSIPFLFCLATCYAPERRFRGCKEFENYRSFVTPYMLTLASLPLMPAVIHIVITEGVATITLILLIIAFSLYLYIFFWYLGVRKWCTRRWI
jgi:hypothetical protein